MAFAPIALTIPQYENYPNWWMKAYNQGTTTPITGGMATDSTGGTTATKYELDSNGFPITAGSALVIPHLEGDYDLWLFPTAAEADANDTTGAIQLADDLNADPLSNAVSSAIQHSTLADLKASTTTSGSAIVLGRTSNGDGYQGIFVWIGTDQSSNVTNDPKNGVYVPPNSDTTGASGAWKRVYSDRLNVLWFGAVADSTGSSGTDNQPFFQAAVDFLPASYGGTVYIPAGRYWVVLSTDIRNSVAGNTTKAFTQGGVYLELDARAIIDSHSNPAFTFAGSSGASVLNRTGIKGGVVVGTTDGATSGILANNVAHFTYDGTSISGFKSTTPTNRSGLYIKYGIYVQIDKPEINNCDFGIRISDSDPVTPVYRPTTIEINNGRVGSCYDGINSADAISLHIHGGFAAELCSNVGIYLTGDRTTGVNSLSNVIEACYFEDNLIHIKVDNNGGTSNNITIRDNYFDSVTGTVKLNITANDCNIDRNSWGSTATNDIWIAGGTNNRIGIQSGTTSFLDSGTNTINEILTDAAITMTSVTSLDVSGKRVIYHNTAGNIDTLTGGYIGQTVIFRSLGGAVKSVRDAAVSGGNIHTNTDTTIAVDSANDTVEFMCVSESPQVWIVIGSCIA